MKRTGNSRNHKPVRTSSLSVVIYMPRFYSTSPLFWGGEGSPTEKKCRVPTYCNLSTGGPRRRLLETPKLITCEENIVEWLPVFIIHAGAMVALGKPAICVLLCVPYTARDPRDHLGGSLFS